MNITATYNLTSAKNLARFAAPVRFAVSVTLIAGQAGRSGSGIPIPMGYEAGRNARKGRQRASIPITSPLADRMLSPKWSATRKRSRPEQAFCVNSKATMPCRDAFTVSKTGRERIGIVH